MSGRYTLRFAGYAALFNLVDAARDIIRPGAFTRTLRERTTPLPLFWQHRAAQVVGEIELAEQDCRGLRVVARIYNPYCRAAAALQTKSVSGLSFGYRARLYRLLPEGRLLEDVDLLEVSLVSHPLQHGARVHLVR